jgi:2-polyprenyl-3-methyl-5-hydroxy-6-metoxy-1,4-benzoquinol methylase
MGFFDFLAGIDRYAASGSEVARMNRRFEHIVEPFRAEIAGARALDLAAHDGRWSYALAGAGAASVDGVEVRPELIAQFAAYPDTPFKARVRLMQGDLFDALEGFVREGGAYDVVAVFGILYHLMDHHRLFVLIRRLRPRLVIVDSEFMTHEWPMVQLIREDPSNILNAAAYYEGQEKVLKGIPSSAAMEAIADTLGYRTEWVRWEDLAPDRRKGVPDYFRKEKMIRRTCALRPK